MSLSAPRPNEFLPDPRRAALPDILERNIYFAGTEEVSHTTLTVGNEQSTLATEMMRVRAVEVDDIDTDTVTIQVYIDDIPLFDDAERPVSGGGVKETSSLFHIRAGTEIRTVIEAVTGVPAGEANVLIDTEPYVLVPKAETVTLKGRHRLFPSRRRAAAGYNAIGDRSAEAVIERNLSGIGSGEGGSGAGGGTTTTDGTSTPGTGGVRGDITINPPRPAPKPGGGGGLPLPK